MHPLRRTLLCISTACALSVGALSLSAMAATPVALTGELKGSNEVPAVMTNASGIVEASLAPDTNILTWKITYSGLSGPVTGAHFHGPAMAGQNAGVAVPVTGSLISPVSGSATLTTAQAADLTSGRWYLNLHTATNPNGEARAPLNIRP